MVMCHLCQGHLFFGSSFFALPNLLCLLTPRQELAKEEDDSGSYARGVFALAGGRFQWVMVEKVVDVKVVATQIFCIFTPTLGKPPTS